MTLLWTMTKAEQRRFAKAGEILRGLLDASRADRSQSDRPSGGAPNDRRAAVAAAPAANKRRKRA